MAKLCADSALEAHAGSCTESEVVDYLMNLPERARKRLLTHGHIAISRALEFNKEPNGFVKALLDQPEIQVNSVDLDGNTLLVRAVVMRNKEVVGMLLARADLDPSVGNVTTRDTPVHFASQPGSSLEILGMLLSDSRVIVAALNRDEQSSLHAAGMLKNRRSDAARVSDVILMLVNSAKEKLKSVPDFLQKTDVHGRNVQHYAAESGLGDAVSELRKLDHTLALVHDNKGLQPVHLATQSGHLQVVKLLLPDGRGRADDLVQECLQAKRSCSLDPEHCSMLHLAQELLALTRHRDIADFLLREFNVYTSRIEAKESPSLFQWAVTVHDSGGHGARLIPHILKWQAEKVNAPFNDVEHQRTALIVSAIAGNPEVVEALCRENGPWQLDGTRRDDKNKAALDYGFEKNHVDVCRILR